MQFLMYLFKCELVSGGRKQMQEALDAGQSKASERRSSHSCNLPVILPAPHVQTQ